MIRVRVVSWERVPNEDRVGRRGEGGEGGGVVVVGVDIS